MRFDSTGNIYVGNYGGGAGGLGNVNVFTSAGVLSQTITNGVANPAGMAIASGNLYVGNFGNNTVTIYTAATGVLTSTIR